MNWQPAVPATALLFCAVYPPEGGPRFMICPFRTLTGWVCPFCGMTRAMAALGHGQWDKAIAYHALSPLVMAALIGWFAWSFFRPLRTDRIPNAAWWTVLGAFAGFNLLRWWGTIGSPPA